MTVSAPQSTGSLLIFGASGHGRVVADAALLEKRWAKIVASDRDAARCKGELLPGVALVPAEAAVGAAGSMSRAHVAIGNNAFRERESAAIGHGRLVAIVHPAAVVSPFCTVADGCFVAAAGIVGPGAALGMGVIVNHGAVVDHDVSVGAFSHIAPHATLGGNVRVGQRVLIGGGATVLPGMRIGDDITVGAGAVVTSDLAAPGVYAGVPARRIK